MIDIMWIFLADVVCDGDEKDKVKINYTRLVETISHWDFVL